MLEVRDLHVKFHNRDREAVAGVTFTLKDGEILGLVGESGSGKSVTAMSIAGLLPRKKCSYQGEVLVDGEDMLHAKRALLRKVQGNKIGVVFQEPMSAMDPLMKVGKQVEEVLVIHTDLSAEERKKRAIQALTDVELPDPEAVYNKYPHELSGGMLQRSMIAAAIVSRPSLLLLDEPTTALDVTIQAQILELMLDIQKKLGMAIIMVTHDLGVIAEMCDEIIVMYGGRVCERGTADEIFYNPRHEYTKGLLHSIPSVTGTKEKLQPIEGTPINMLNMPKGCAFCPRCKEAMKVCLTEVPEELRINENHTAACWINVRDGYGKEAAANG